jgi:PAS domain S-box-containing protein
MQLSITFMVLLLFSVILSYFKIRTYRNYVVNELSSLALVIGNNSASALTFLDNAAADEVLSSLKMKEHVANAWINDKDGNLFATYSKKGFADFSFPKITGESSRISRDYITVSARIQVDDELIGLIALRLSTEENRRAVSQSIVSAVIVLLIGMIIALFLAIVTQKHVTDPILYLAKTVKRVSETTDYSVRVRKQGNDEIGDLYDGFNNMMGQVSTREIERDRAYASLSESENRFKTLVSNIPGATYRCKFDKEWTMEYISDEVEKISGYPASDFINNNVRSYASIIHHEDTKLAEDTAEKAIAEKMPFEIEYRVICADKSIRWVYEKGQGAFDDTGKVLWLDGAIFDITERKQAENLTQLQQQQLIQADKMATLGILVSGVAHEINNPNNFMLLNSNNLADVWQDVKPMLDKHYKKNGDFIIAGMPYSEMKDDIASLINGISEGAERIRKIVQSLKDFARQDAGGMGQLVKVNSIIESSTIILSNLIKKNTDNFNIDYDENLPDIKGNSQQIEQVIINLVGNACQALEDKGKSITITTAHRKKENEVLITVSDEGKGIPPEDLKHIMDPFFTTKRDSGGTGLGLSISYNIIKDHGGDLTIESEQGKGTKAIVTLPAAT